MEPEQMGDAIYTAANGSGKERLNSNSELKPRVNFRCNFLITGEVSTSQHISEGGKQETAGQMIRVLDLPAIVGALGVFDSLSEEFKHPRDFSNYLKEQSIQYYGSTLIAFLEKLILPENLKKIPEKITCMREALINDEDFGSQVGRALDRFVLAAVAGELATEWGLTGWNADEAKDAALKCFKAWLSERLGGTCNQESVRILRQVRTFFIAHGSSRFEDIALKIAGNDLLESKTINRCGFRELKGDRWIYYVPTESFAEIHKGFSKNAAIKALVEAGWLDTTPNKKSQIEACRQKKIKGVGNMRCYVFTRTLDEDEVTSGNV